MYGKIIDGNLQIARNIIKTDKGVITNPKAEQLIELGYKEIEHDTTPEYDEERYKLKEIYIDGDTILISYEVVALTDEEKLEIKKQKVVSLEEKYNMCRWQRELILAQNSGASDYTKTKAQEIEDIAEELR